MVVSGGGGGEAGGGRRRREFSPGQVAIPLSFTGLLPQVKVDSEASQLSARQVVRYPRFHFVFALGDVGRDLHALDGRNEELHVVDFVQLSLPQAGAVTRKSVLFQKERTSVFG